MPDREEEHTLTIGDAVRFAYGERTIHGHLLRRQGRQRFARVIDADERRWKVPEAALTPSGGARRATMVTPDDEARAAWRVGDRVAFTNREGPRRGEIVKLNPMCARVRSGTACWKVPYDLLSAAGDAGRQSVRNGAERLTRIAAMARSLMDEHGLGAWTFAFFEAERRLGDCHYQERLIRVSRTHALEAGEAEIRDTVLHEIAHALAGPEARHGPLWKATARRLGATPRANVYKRETP